MESMWAREQGRMSRPVVRTSGGMRMCACVCVRALVCVYTRLSVERRDEKDTE